jgi:hypothetical protein
MTKVIGSRTILNTEFPVIRKIEKYRRAWIILEICNGTGEEIGSFRTKREAIAAF